MVFDIVNSFKCRTYIYIYIYDAGPLYWPTFVVAVLASIIASQAIISRTFSIIQQSLSLGCFPWVKVIHTEYEGQVYVPEANYLLMLACVAVTLGFRTTTNIGNAYGNPLRHLTLHILLVAFTLSHTNK